MHRPNHWMMAPLVVVSALLLVISVLVLSPSSSSAASASVESSVHHSRSSNLLLKQVHVITRHGDRTPLEKLPNIEDPEWDCYTSPMSILSTYPPFFPSQITTNNVPRVYAKSYLNGKQFFKGNCSAGQLTNIGAWQHFNLGLQFHAQYVERLGFINSTFDPDTVWIRSTDVHRTLESAQCQLLALFPPPPVPSPNKQIIPINTVEPSQEYMNPNPSLCPLLNVLAEQLKKTPQWLSHEKETQPLKEKLASYFNITPTALPDWSTLMDQFTCRASHGIPYPPGITQNIVDTVRAYAEWELAFLFSDRNVAKYAVGLFLQEILQNMQNVISGSSRLRWLFYSAHDTTVGPVLLALQAFGNQVPAWPPYAAHIVMELYQDQNSPNDWWLQLLYNDAPLIMPGCGQTLCRFSNFASLVNSVVPKDFRGECNGKKAQPDVASPLASEILVTRGVHTEAAAALFNAN